MSKRKPADDSDMDSDDNSSNESGSNESGSDKTGGSRTSDSSGDSGDSGSSLGSGINEVLSLVVQRRGDVEAFLTEIHDVQATLAELAKPLEEMLGAGALADAGFLRSSPFRRAALALRPDAAAHLASASFPLPATAYAPGGRVTVEQFAAGLRLYVVEHGLADASTGAITPDALLAGLLLTSDALGDDGTVSFVALLAGMRRIAV